MDIVKQSQVENVIRDHHYFCEMVRHVTAYAKVHNLPKDLVFDGLAWNADAIATAAYQAGLRQGMVDQSFIVFQRLGLTAPEE